MCILCSEAVAKAVARGIPEQEAIDFLWEYTPFPMGEPTPDQLKQLENLRHL